MNVKPDSDPVSDGVTLQTYVDDLKTRANQAPETFSETLLENRREAEKLFSHARGCWYLPLKTGQAQVMSQKLPKNVGMLFLGLSITLDDNETTNIIANAALESVEERLAILVASVRSACESIPEASPCNMTYNHERLMPVVYATPDSRCVLDILIYYELLVEKAARNWFTGQLSQREYQTQIVRWRNEIYGTVDDCQSQVDEAKARIDELRAENKSAEPASIIETRLFNDEPASSDAVVEESGKPDETQDGDDDPDENEEDVA